MQKVKTIVREVLNIPSKLDDYWSILDVYPKKDPKLALAHYCNDFNKETPGFETLRWVRGTIVDIKSKTLVSETFGYTDSVTIAYPMKSNTNIIIGKAPNFDTMVGDNKTIKYPRESKLDSSITLYPGYSGVYIRLFVWDDKVFFSTHKKIDASESKWGDGEFFYESFLRLIEVNAPFDYRDLGNQWSNQKIQNEFILSSESTRLYSCKRDNRIIFLGTRITKNGKSEFYSESEFLYLSNPELFSGEPDAFSTTVDRPPLYQHNMLIDYKTANKLLFPKNKAEKIPDTEEAKAYNPLRNEIVIKYEDSVVKEVYSNSVDDVPELSGGDIVYGYVKDGHRTKVIRIYSPGAVFRKGIIQENPVLYCNFVSKMNEFITANPGQIMKSYPGMVDDLSSMNKKMRFWYDLYTMSVTPGKRTEVSYFYGSYAGDIEKLSNFLYHEYRDITRKYWAIVTKLNMGYDINSLTVMDMRIVSLHKVVIRTYTQANNLLEQAYKNSETDEDFYILIRRYLYTTPGVSVYKLIVTMRKFNKLKVKFDKGLVPVKFGLIPNKNPMTLNFMQ